tara:strand:- start:452 stop:799 length:348 start_codon:yes stop_codon:yes gene_type:complete
MKVADLEIGCLVKPKPQFTLRIATLYQPTGEQHRLGVEELRGMGFNHHATMSSFQPKFGIDDNGCFDAGDKIAIYTGAITLGGIYFGVKKQHTFIIDGLPIIMDGYEIKGFEKIQ